MTPPRNRTTCLLVVFLALLAGRSPRLAAQELNATVTVNAQQIQGVDQNVFRQMEKDIREYVNNTRFTDHVFKSVERIKCNFNIRINRAPSNKTFEGRLTVQLIRPVYNATFESLILKYSDDNFNFEYVPFQQLRYSENTFVDNLTSMLNFWALMVIGFDYDTFGKSAGMPYFKRARNIANLASNSSESGWQPLDGRDVRYWMMENMLNNSYGVMHEILYKYHRQGLDQMFADASSGRKAVMESLEKLHKLSRENPNLLVVREFMRAKKGEIIDIFSDGFPDDKQRLIQIMKKLDPNNLGDYKKILDEN